MRDIAQRDVPVAIGGMETVSKGPSYRAIGSALGLSHTMARKLHEKQGMPRDSIESARAWYELNGHHKGGNRKMETPGGSFQTVGASTSVPGLRPNLVAIDDLAAAAAALPDQGTLNRLLTAARVRVTDLEAEQDKVDAQIRDGLLVKADDVKRIGMARAAALRDRLLGLPAELAIQLAALQDPALAADLLRKRLKAALTEYCAAYGVTAESR